MRYSLAILAAFAAVNASPLAMPQGVTAMIKPSGAAPPGCMPSMSGEFGVAVMNVTGGMMGASQAPDGQPQASSVKQISDGQPQVTSGMPVSEISDGQPQATTGMPVSQISDGQIQNPTMTAAPISQISDGQIQATKMVTMAPVTQISDGQIQATYAPVSQISDGQIQATKTAPPVSQISDGQPQVTPAPPVSQISDGQPQATPAPAVSEKSDGQPNASGVSEKPDGQPQATSTAGGSGVMMVGCKSDSSLTLTLDGGILKDSQGRTGYIASNYQFQFDAPPQAGAIYTAGWSVCGNGSLALGGSTMFYQCLSGGFYNLYNENWAPQCNAVTINVLELVTC